MTSEPETELSEFASTLVAADLSNDVIGAATALITWTLSSSYAGASTSIGRKVLRHVSDSSTSMECTIIGAPVRATPELAGIANGTFAKVRESEDKYWLSPGHGFAVGAGVVPAAIAASDIAGGVDGATFTTAVVAGAEVQIRVLRSLTGYTHSKGWNASYFLAGIGSAVAAAKILGLDPPSLADAVGLAFVQAAGNMQGTIEGNTGVSLQMGFSVRNGLVAAQLAAHGIKGASAWLTGTYGLGQLIAPGQDVGLEELTAGLGDRYHLLDLGYKAYPCGGLSHTAVEATIQLTRKLRFNSDHVKAIHVQGGTNLESVSFPILQKQRPTDIPSALFSLPWAIACAAIDGDLTLDHYTDASILNPRYLSMAQKVEVAVAPTLTDVLVEIVLEGGESVMSNPGIVPAGHPGNPLTFPALIERCRVFLRHGLAPVEEETIGSALDRTAQLFSSHDISEVVSGFVPFDAAVATDC